MCTSVDTHDACGDPAEYPSVSLHPQALESPASPAQLELLDFQVPQGSDPIGRVSTLIVTDGSLRAPGDAVRLANVLPVLARRNTADHSSRIALLQGRDRYLIRLWKGRGQLGSALSRAGFSAAIGPGYSTWADHTPWESLVAMAMSASVAVDLVKYLPTVPTVVWRTHEDLGRWAPWIRRNAPSCIAMHSGAMRTEDEWAWWCAGVTELSALLLADSDLPLPRLLVNGPTAPQRLRDVRDAWPGRTTYVTQHPWELAIHGKVLLPDLTTEVAARHEDVGDLLTENRRAFEAFVNLGLRTESGSSGLQAV